MSERIARTHLLIAHLCGSPEDILWPAASDWFYGQIASLTGAAALDWLKAKGSLKNDKRYAKAVRAILGVIDSPLREWAGFFDFASDFLTYLAYLTVIPHNNPKKPARRRPKKQIEIQESWAAGTGKTWKALTEFPDQLVRMADMVEHMNTNPFFKLDELPPVLRRGAEHLRERVATVPRLHAEAFPRTSARDDLRRVAEKWTGQPRAELVVELHQAAIAALDGQESAYSPEALYQAGLRARSKKRRA